MAQKINVSALADRDVDECAEYLAKRNFDAALRFLKAVNRTYERIGLFPGSGSPRYAHLPMLERLRCMPVPEFEQYLVFYLEYPTRCEVVRVLHCSRDLPEILQE